jgi:uncharacterized protein YutE (UPF0331/DUF86 family)
VQPDPERIKKYINDMATEVEDMRELLFRPDDELLGETHLLKALKYSVIVIAESMANVLQHVLAKRYNVVVRGFTEVFIKAKDHRLIPDELIDQLLPFARFRNMLVHQYWRVDDRAFLGICAPGWKVSERLRAWHGQWLPSRRLATRPLSELGHDHGPGHMGRLSHAPAISRGGKVE